MLESTIFSTLGLPAVLDGEWRVGLGPGERESECSKRPRRWPSGISALPPRGAGRPMHTATEVVAANLALAERNASVATEVALAASG